jgi:hypothetical protein
MTDLSTVDAHDKLVLYFEDECKDTYCYVLYNFAEREYFICGARTNILNEKYCPFNFYCKSKTTLLEYLKFVFDVAFCNMTYGLYNYYNIFGYKDYVDLEILDVKRNDLSEITVYCGTHFKPKIVYNLLKMLKEIRY